MTTRGQALVEQLRREGVEIIFDIPGVQPDWALDTVVSSSDGFAVALDAAKAQGGPWLIEVRTGEMPGPRPLIHPFVPSPDAPPPDPLGEPPDRTGAAN